MLLTIDLMSKVVAEENAATNTASSGKSDQNSRINKFNATK